jgi:hypothetical protein
MPTGQLADLPAGWQFDFSAYAVWAKARRSIRTFRDEPVPRERIEQLLDVVRYAPSGINLQPVRWLVIHETGKVRELTAGVIAWMRQLVASGAEIAQTLRLGDMLTAWDEGKDRICRGAPHVLIAAGLKEDMAAGQACVIALTHLELAAHAAGLGACWAGYVHLALLQSETVRKSVGMSHRLNPHGAMLLGNPRFAYHRIPVRQRAVVTWR